MTRRAAVLGSPIAHSLSPTLHLAAYRVLGLDWTYEAIEVDEATLPAFMAALDGTWAGLSLTMPLKEAVIPLLAQVDDLALRLSSVNTVVPGPAGWRGANTDVHGIVRALERHRPGLARAVVLGSGATARSAVAALAELGVGAVVVVARRPEAAADLAALATSFGLPADVADFTPDPALMQADVVVSTLPGDAGRPWAPACALARGVLLAAAYPPGPTPLAHAWPTDQVASGRDMLLWQAVEQVRLMTGRPAPAEAMAAALAVAEASAGEASGI